LSSLLAKNGVRMQSLGTQQNDVLKAFHSSRWRWVSWSRVAEAFASESSCQCCRSRWSFRVTSRRWVIESTCCVNAAGVAEAFAFESRSFWVAKLSSREAFESRSFRVRILHKRKR